MKVHQRSLRIPTDGRGFTDLGAAVTGVVAESGVETGVCVVFVCHTSASLVVQENADPAVRRDLERWLGELAPEARAWEHADEGPDDMPAHARAALGRTSETIPVTGGRLGLGTWQGLYLWEHRRARHQRTLTVTVIGA
ncbi:MAG: YjbQ family protein [Polyangiaceae bacterium]|nr:YjbQ family protein [Polyangiaceae bacterium]